MQPHIRAILAAAAIAVVTRRKVAGIYDHVTGRHLRLAAECRDDLLQGFDDDRKVAFGGRLPELFDEGEGTFVSLEQEGATVRGYDRGSGAFYLANVEDGRVQLYDYGEAAWFTFDAQTV